MKILETSQQYKLRTEEESKNKACPECGCGLSFGSYVTESKGFFNIKTIRQIHTVRCLKCGCKYEYTESFK